MFRQFLLRGETAPGGGGQPPWEEQKKACRQRKKNLLILFRGFLIFVRVAGKARNPAFLRGDGQTRGNQGGQTQHREAKKKQKKFGKSREQVM